MLNQSIIFDPVMSLSLSFSVFHVHVECCVNIFPCFICRPHVPRKLDVTVFHGGNMTCDPCLPYVGGLCETIEAWDTDVISSIEVGKVVKALAYGSFKSLWYAHTDGSGSIAIKPLNCDADVRQWLADVQGLNQADVFVEHTIEHAKPSEGLLLLEGRNLEGGGEKQNVYVVDLDNDSDVAEIEIVKEKEVVGDAEQEGEGGSVSKGKEKVVETYVSKQGEGSSVSNGKKHRVEEVDQGSENSDDSDDSEYNPSEGSVISLDDSDYEEDFDWGTALPA